MALVGGVDAFVSGLLHPVLAPAHLISLLGLGLVACRGVFSAQIQIPAAFACGLVAGLGAIAWGAGETRADDVLAVITAMSGLAAAMGIAAPVWLISSVALICGIALGLDSPPDVISLGEAVLMLIGTACGGVAALAAIMFSASAIARLWQGVVLRIAGSWIAAITILVLALRWAG
jgi:urease accessory protein